MRSVYIIIVIALSLCFIIITLAFGKSYLQTSSGFGTYSKAKVGRCKGDSCDQPGQRFEWQTCEPNPLTGLGCVNDKGILTYATVYRESECSLQCKRSVWKITTEPCIPNPTPNKPGLQRVVYECVNRDPQGINACTLGGQGGFQEVKVFEPGDILEFEVPCIPPS